MSWIKIILLFVITSIGSSAFHLLAAQPQSFYFTSYGVKDGMSFGLVNDLFRDSEGFLWIGTFNGLNRFDGTGFKVFYANQHDSSTLVSNDVLRVCEDHEGNIWCATNKGVSCYDKSKGSFSNYVLSNRGFNVLANVVNEILCDRHGTIWCGTKAGIFEYDKIHDRFVGYYHNDKNAASPSDDHVYKNSFVEDPVKDGIWFTGKKGINFLDTKTRLFYNYKNNPEQLSIFDSSFIYPLCFDSKNRLWYIHRSRPKMMCYDISSHSITPNDLVTGEKDRPFLLDVETIFIDAKQQHWISTWTHPGFFKGQNDKMYRRFFHDDQLVYSINSY